MISTALSTISDLLDTSEGASVDELAPGMHVVAHRIGYQHHGIYIGNGQVVAYLRDEGVTICSWKKFEDGDKVTVLEHDDAQFSAQEIVQRARSRIGEDDYSLIFNNCEHFANWCVTGKAKSYQVREATVTALAFASATTLAIRHAATAARVGSAGFTAIRAVSAVAGAGASASTVGAVGSTAAAGLATVAIPVVAGVATTVAVSALLSHDEVKDTISDAVDSVTGAASEAFDSVSDIASNAYDTVSDIASDTYTTVTDVASNVTDSVSDFFKELFD